MHIGDLGGSQEVHDASTGTVTFDPKEYAPKVAPKDGEEEEETKHSQCDVALAEQTIAAEKLRLRAELKLETYMEKYYVLEDQLNERTIMSNMYSKLVRKLPVHYQKQLDAKDEEIKHVKAFSKLRLDECRVDSQEMVETIENEHEKVLKERDTLHDQAVVDLKTAHEEEINILKLEMQNQELVHDQAVVDLKAAHEEEINKLKLEMQNTKLVNDEEMSATTREYEGKLVQMNNEMLLLVENHNATQSSLVSRHEKEILSLKEKHEEEVASQTDKHVEVVANLTTVYKTRIEALDVSIEEMKNSHDADVNRMSEECKEQMTKESNDSINKITLLIEKFDIERADINKNHSLQVKRLEEEITDIVADGETKYEKLRRSHDEEISAMTANFKEEYRLLDKRNKDLSKEYETKVSLLKAKSEVDLADLSKILTNSTQSYEKVIESLNMKEAHLRSVLKECESDVAHFSELHFSQGFCNTTLIQLYLETEYDKISDEFARVYESSYDRIQRKVSDMTKRAEKRLMPMFEPVLEIVQAFYIRDVRPHVKSMQITINEGVKPALQKINAPLYPLMERANTFGKHLFNKYVHPHVEPYKHRIPSLTKSRMLCIIFLVFVLRRKMIGRTRKVKKASLTSVKKEPKEDQVGGRNGKKIKMESNQ